jgi:DNA-binding LytR/AlgR family response regulator
MQHEMNYLELAKILLQFAVVPIIAFVWMHYKMSQGHAVEIAVIKTEFLLTKENHDREFKEVKESFKSVMLKLDEIQKALPR